MIDRFLSYLSLTVLLASACASVVAPPVTPEVCQAVAASLSKGSPIADEISSAAALGCDERVRGLYCDHAPNPRAEICEP